MAVDKGNSLNFALNFNVKADTSGIQNLIADIKAAQAALNNLEIPDGLKNTIEQIKGISSSISSIRKRLNKFSSDEVKAQQKELIQDISHLESQANSISRSNANKDVIYALYSEIKELKSAVLNKATSNQTTKDDGAYELNSSVNKLDTTIKKADADFSSLFKNQILDTALKGKQRQLSGFEKLEYSLTGKTDFSEKIVDYSKLGIREIRNMLNRFVDSELKRRNLYQQGYTDKSNNNLFFDYEFIKKSLVKNIYKFLKDYAVSEQFNVREFVEPNTSNKRKRVTAKMGVDLGSAVTQVEDIFARPLDVGYSGRIRTSNDPKGKPLLKTGDIEKRNIKIKEDILNKFNDDYIDVFKAFSEGPAEIAKLVTNIDPTRIVAKNLKGMIEAKIGKNPKLNKNSTELSNVLENLKAYGETFDELLNIRKKVVENATKNGIANAGRIVNAYFNQSGIGKNKKQKELFAELEKDNDFKSLKSGLYNLQANYMDKNKTSLVKNEAAVNKDSSGGNGSFIVNSLTSISNGIDNIINILNSIDSKIGQRNIKTLKTSTPNNNTNIPTTETKDINIESLRNKRKVFFANGYHVSNAVKLDNFGETYISDGKALTDSQIMSSEAGRNFTNNSNMDKLGNLFRVQGFSAPGYIFDPSRYSDEKSAKDKIFRDIRYNANPADFAAGIVKVQGRKEKIVVHHNPSDIKKNAIENFKDRLMERYSDFSETYNGEGLKDNENAKYDIFKHHITFKKDASIGTRAHEYSHANRKFSSILPIEELVADLTASSFGEKSHYSNQINDIVKKLNFTEDPAKNAKLLVEYILKDRKKFTEIAKEISKRTGVENPFFSDVKYKWNIADQLKAIAHMYDNMKGFAITKTQADSIESESHKVLKDFFDKNATKHEKLIYPSYEAAMEEDQHDFMLDWQRSSSGPYKSHQKELVDKIGYSLLNTKNKKIRDKFKDADYAWDGNIHVKTFADDVSSYTGGEIIDELRKVFSNDEVMEILKDAGVKGIKNIGEKRTLARSEFRDSYDDVKIDDKDRYYFDKIFDDESKRRKKQKKKKDNNLVKITREIAEELDISDISWAENAFSTSYLMPQYDIFKKFRQAQRVSKTGILEGSFRSQAEANDFIDSLNRANSVAHKIEAYLGDEIVYDEKGNIQNKKIPGMYSKFYTTKTNLTDEYLSRGEKDTDNFSYMRRMLSALMTYTPSKELVDSLRTGRGYKAYQSLDDNSAIFKKLLNAYGIKFNAKDDFEKTMKKLFVGQGVTDEKARKIGEIIAQALREELKRGVKSSIVSTESPDDIKKREKKLQKERINALKEDIAMRAEPKALSTAGNVINKVAMYGTVTAVFYGLVHGIRDAINTMKTFETQLVETTKVLNPVYEGTTRISDAAQEFGQKYGTSIVNVASSMSVFAQQGKSVSETINLTEASLLAANTTTLKATEATEALTAAMKQFNISDKDAKSVIDSWLEVESRTAVTAKTMALALRQTGTVAKSSGISFHELNGIISAVGSATRESGNAIGTALKYIFSHMNTEDVIEQFSKLGIAVYDSDGKMRGLMDRLSSLNEKWKDMSGEQRTATAISIAGTRRYNSLMILMDKWNDVLEATKMSEDSYGRAMAMNTRVMGTYAKQIEKTKATMESFFASSFESGGKGLLNYFESLKQAIASVGAVLPSSISSMIGGASVIGLGTFGIGRAFSYSGLGDYLNTIDRRRSEGRMFDKNYDQIMNPIYGRGSRTISSFRNIFKGVSAEQIEAAQKRLNEFKLIRVEDPLHPGAMKLGFKEGSAGDIWANKLRERGVAEEKIMTLSQRYYIEKQKEIDVLKKSTGVFGRATGRIEAFGMQIQRHAAAIGMIGIGMMSIANSKLFEDKYSATGKNVAGQTIDIFGALATGAAAGAVVGGPWGAGAGALVSGAVKGFEYVPKWGEDIFGSVERENSRLLKQLNMLKNLDSAMKEYRALLDKKNRGNILTREEEARFRETQNIVMMTEPSSVEFNKRTGRANISRQYQNKFAYSTEEERNRLYNQMAYNTMFGGGGLLGTNRQNVFESEILDQRRKTERARARALRSSGTSRERYQDEYRQEFEKLQELINQQEQSFEGFFGIYKNIGSTIANYTRNKGSNSNALFGDRGKEDVAKMYKAVSNTIGEQNARERILSTYIGERTGGRSFEWHPDLKKRANVEAKITELVKRSTNKDGSSVYDLIETDITTGKTRLLKSFTMKKGATSFSTIQQAIEGTGLKSTEVFHLDSATQDYFELPLKTVDKFIATINKISDSTQKRLSLSLKYAEEDFRLVQSSTLFDPNEISKLNAFRKSAQNRKGLFGNISPYIEEMKQIGEIEEGYKRVPSRAAFGAKIASGELSGTASGALLSNFNKIGTYSDKLATLSTLISMNFGSENKGGTNLEADSISSQTFAIKQINEYLKERGMNTSFEQISESTGSKEKARLLVLDMISSEVKDGVEETFKSIDDIVKSVLEFHKNLKDVFSTTDKAIKVRAASILTANRGMDYYEAERMARSELEINYEVPEQFKEEINNLRESSSFLEEFINSQTETIKKHNEELEKAKEDLLKAQLGGDSNAIKRLKEIISGKTGAISKERELLENARKRKASVDKEIGSGELLLLESGISKGTRRDYASYIEARNKEQIRRATEGINTSRNLLGGTQIGNIDQAYALKSQIESLATSRLQERGYYFNSYEDINKRFNELDKGFVNGTLSPEEKKEYAELRNVIQTFNKDVENIGSSIQQNQKSMAIAVGKAIKEDRTRFAKFDFYALTGNKGTAQEQALLSKNLFEETTRQGVVFFEKYRNQMSSESRKEFISLFKDLNNIQDIVDRESNLSYRKSYLLASNQERAMIDMIDARRQHGETMEGIFADPFMKEYAKKHSTVGMAIEYGLQREANQRLLDAQITENNFVQKIYEFLQNNISKKDENSKLAIENLGKLIQSASENFIRSQPIAQESQNTVTPTYNTNPKNAQGAAEGFAGFTGSGGKHQSSGFVEVHKGEGLGVINATAMARNPELAKKILSMISSMNKGEIVGFDGGTKLNDTASFYSSLERLNDVVSRGVEQSSYATNVRLNAIEKALKDIFGINGVMETRLLPPDSGVNYVTHGNIFVGPNSTPQTRTHELLHGRAYDTYNIGLGRSFGVREMMSELGSFAITGKAIESGYTNRDMVRALNSDLGLNSKSISQRLANMFDYMRKNPKEIFKYIKDIEKSVGDNINKGGDFVYRSGSKSLRMDVARGIEELGSVSIELAKKMGATSRQISVLEKSINKAASKYSNGTKTIDDSVSRMYNTKNNVVAQTMLRNEAIEFGDTYSGNGIILGRRAGVVDYINGNMYDKLLAGPVGGVKGFYNKRINPVLNSTSNFISNVGKGVKGVARGIVGNPIGMLMAANAVKDITENGINFGNASQLAIAGAPYIPSLFKNVDSQKLSSILEKTPLLGKGLSKVVGSGFVGKIGGFALKKLPAAMIAFDVLPQLLNVYRNGWNNDSEEALFNTSQSLLTNIAFAGIPAATELVNSLFRNSDYTRQAANITNAFGSILMLASRKNRDELQDSFSIARRNWSKLGFLDKFEILIDKDLRNNILNSGHNINKSQEEYSQDAINRYNLMRMTFNSQDTLENARNALSAKIIQKNNKKEFDIQNKQAGATLAILAGRNTSFNTNKERIKLQKLREKTLNRTDLKEEDLVNLIQNLDDRIKNIDIESSRRTYARTFSYNQKQADSDIDAILKKNDITYNDLLSQLRINGYSGTEYHKKAQALLDIISRKKQVNNQVDRDNSIIRIQEEERNNYANEYKERLYREFIGKEKTEETAEYEIEKFKGDVNKIIKETVKDSINKKVNKDKKLKGNKNKIKTGPEKIDGIILRTRLNEKRGFVNSSKDDWYEQYKIDLEERQKEEARQQASVEEHEQEQAFADSLAKQQEEDDKKSIANDSISNVADNGKNSSVNNQMQSEDAIKTFEDSNKLIEALPDNLKPFFQSIVSPLNVIVELIKKSNESPSEIGPTIINSNKLNAGDKIPNSNI